ncbi:MAG TPA: aminotransferase class I/II-fold pyridoxal phosphate-dependent enzyme [Pyrinomonadaceae bacterium]|jgi:glycine C-acetyltransferase|nr:aminotransferase class I/II-fold pyridoxal phosphate-dependent enzyme [Pyrinomonadaceae bacterium]
MTSHSSPAAGELAATNESDAFNKHLGMFTHPKGSNLLERTRRLGDWLGQRVATGTWPYSRALETRPETTASVKSSNGITVNGVNFGSQDYLGLASHPSIHDAAIRALSDYGPHSAASAILQGNTGLSRQLEAALGEHVGAEHVLLFPTGWAAGFGTIVGLVRPNDHVLLDQNAHSCLMQGARAATDNHSFFRHNDVGDARRRLARIRAKDSENAVLVVTEGVFSMDSDSPDIARLQDVCREFDAVLLVDVAHDLGASGPSGTGQLGLQDMLGKVDLVMGAFSKTFSSNGGFLATREASVKHFVSIYGGPHAFSNALSPIQAGVVLEALRIVRSPEGERLRARSASNILRLREAFTAAGLHCYGQPSPIVPVGVGDERLAKWTGRALEENGLIANLVEYPAVARGKARFRFQVMATHTAEQIDLAARIFTRSLEEVRHHVGA